MSITRTYAGWKQPFITVFGGRLREEITDMADPERLLVWVPSVRAIRHILNELLAYDAEMRRGIHPPTMVTPAGFLRTLLEGRCGLATEMQCLRAWKEVLLGFPVRELSALLPVVPTHQRVQWGYALAQQMRELHGRLAMEDHAFEDVAGTVNSGERERWAVLSRLETDYRDWLCGYGLRDPDDFLRENLQELLAEVPYDRALVGGVLNLSPLEERCLKMLKGRGISIELCFPVPGERASEFDAWGRPLAETWNTAPLPASLIEGRIHRAPEPRELVTKTLELARDYGEQVDAMVVGSPDGDLSDYLVERSRLSSTPFYAPVGKLLGTTGFGRLLKHVEQFQKGGSLSTLREMLHNVLFRGWVKQTGWNLRQLEEDLLSVQKESFLFTYASLSSPGLIPLKAAGRIRELVKAMDALFLSNGERPSFPIQIWNFLQRIIGGSSLSEASEAILGQLEEILQELLEQPGEAPLKEEEGWELLRYCLENKAYYPERGADQRPVSGWLELPWETAPHLVILGLPDAEVPGTVGTDTFLSPGLCREVGLRTPEMESAFHACRLRIILEGRRAWGRVDILLPERGLDDYPSQPSRFLFLSPEEEVLSRVQLLLEERKYEKRPIPADFGVGLWPPDPRELSGISVTDFGVYLGNPFGYFLERNLKWQSPEPIPREMDAASFGRLAHSVMEAFNKSDSGRILHEEKDIQEFLEQTLEDIVRECLGGQVALPLRIQVNSLRERLRAAVPDLSRSRQEGWIPFKVEWKTHKETTFQIAGLPLRGVIDLLERNEESGLYRIVDYKTRDKGKAPQAAHLTRLSSKSPPVPFPECVFSDGKVDWCWKDLQLPLYQMVVQETFGGEVTCAYFNLAKAVSEIGLSRFQLTDQHLQSARVCAEAIVRKIQTGEFPYREPRDWKDRWIPWFGEGNAVLDPGWHTRQEGAVR